MHFCMVGSPKGSPYDDHKKMHIILALQKAYYQGQAIYIFIHNNISHIRYIIITYIYI